jgi:hypothetical protein
MNRRIPASMRTRESLSALIEGRLSSADGRTELVKLATRLILEESLEAEARDALGRDYYERGAEEGRGYRNGHRLGRLKTAEGAIEFSTPQIAARDAPFRSEIRQHAKGRTEALEDLAVEMLARDGRDRQPLPLEYSPCRLNHDNFPKSDHPMPPVSVGTIRWKDVAVTNLRGACLPQVGA